jgi:hypothetical protein
VLGQPLHRYPRLNGCLAFCFQQWQIIKQKALPSKPICPSVAAARRLETALLVVAFRHPLFLFAIALFIYLFIYLAPGHSCPCHSSLTNACQGQQQRVQAAVSPSLAPPRFVEQQTNPFQPNLPVGPLSKGKYREETRARRWKWRGKKIRTAGRRPCCECCGGAFDSPSGGAGSRISVSPTSVVDSFMAQRQ